MAEEIAVENGRISTYEGLVTLTLTLDRAILHTVVHHSSTSTYIPNFIEIEETFCGQTGGQIFETGFIRSTMQNQPKNRSATSNSFLPSCQFVTLRAPEQAPTRRTTMRAGAGERAACGGKTSKAMTRACRVASSRHLL